MVSSDSPCPASVEATACKAIGKLSRLVIKQDSAKAAKALHRLVEESVVILNELAIRFPERFKEVASRAIGWPVIYSDLPDEMSRNLQIVRSLRVGSEAGINCTKLNLDDRARRHSAKDEATKVTMILATNIEVLRSIRLGLRADHCSDHELSQRVQWLGQKFRLSKAAKAVLLASGDPGRLAGKSLGGYHSLIWDMLMADSGGYPERVPELRKYGAAKALTVPKEVERLQKDFLLHTEAAVLTHVRKTVAGPGVEKAIRAEIKNKLRQKMASWVR